MRRAAKRQTMRLWIRTRRFVLHNMLHADDPPHSLALGTALGFFVAFTPTMGVQMFLVVFLAWLFRANKVIGVPIVWISNPATFVPIYWPCYALGRFVLQTPPKGRHWWGELRHPPHETLDKLEFFWGKVMEIIAPLTVGCLIVASILGIISYIVSYSMIYTYRMKRFGTATPPSVQPQADD